ncbi:MAG: 50S ribosomal protein L35 [Armatimonadia bacterium]|jgi:large subunit ribosomal protein L35|nr:50S ribosomal protein L35 [Armatimonadia bacterium]
MPKMKTNSAAKKRFRKTAKGRIFHRHTNKGHLNFHKSESRKRRLRKDKELDSSKIKFVKRLLPGT